ncbi:MAG: beta-glucosidase family protein [Acidimicrobiales bacterium]
MLISVVAVGTALLVAVPTVAAPPAAGASGTTPSQGAATTPCRAAAFRLEPLAEAKKQAVAMLGRMTLDQEVTLLHGVGNDKAPSGSIGATAAIPSLGIPAVNQQDGPAGLGDGLTGVTQLPAPEALAATFDPAAAACYGQVVGSEARGKGINLVYGPTINIVRVPQWGRAFEALGEDPDLAGAIGSAEVRGIQRTGTMAQVKHYAVYNQETNRLSAANNAAVGQQALQEIYLAPWRQVLGAHPSSVMCSYATINGSGACQDKALLDGYLDTTLHFAGFVGSDYQATRSTVTAINAGLDQQQPTASHFGPALVAAVEDGQVSRATVREAALRILTEMYRFRLFTDDARGSIKANVASPSAAGVADDVAEEGTVLLKDAGGALPLSPAGKGSIAVIGAAAQQAPVSAGGGSATVKATRVVTPLAAIRAAVRAADPRGAAPTYTAGLPTPADFTPVPGTALSAPYTTPGTSFALSATLVPPETGTYELAYAVPSDFVPVPLLLDGQTVAVNPGTPPRATFTATVHLTAGTTYTLTGPVQSLTWATPDQISQAVDRAAAAAAKAKTAVVVVGDGQESESADRVGLTLPGDQNALVDAVAAANRHTVVVVDAGGPVAMPWLGQVSAVLDAWYPGQADGTALASVLFGGADPSGHLPVTFPTTASSTPVATPSRFPGNAGGVDYAEGVDVGYRWYDATGTTPLFPFGYGLSYTTFSYRDATATVRERHGKPVVTATVRVTNTGRRAGADVAQLYLGQPPADGNPPRQLEAFRRVSLAPGATRTVRFTLGSTKLAAYSSGDAAWRVAPGTYHLWMGDSSSLAQLPARAEVRLARS